MCDSGRILRAISNPELCHVYNLLTLDIAGASVCIHSVSDFSQKVH